MTQLVLARRWGRPLVRLAAALFGVSTLFPVVAAVAPEGWLPSWVGTVDVALAVALIILMLVLLSWAGQNIHSRVKQFSFEVYRVVASLLIVGLVAYFIFGDHIHWSILLVGVAWRAWVFVFSLPSALMIWETSRSTGRREPTPVKQ